MTAVVVFAAECEKNAGYSQINWPFALIACVGIIAVAYAFVAVMRS